MVLFDEVETRRLLELYALLQRNPASVTSSGLLKIRARERLAELLSASFERQWSESQVAVKAKNLRVEYADYVWLTQQPGFASGELSDAWWQGIKARRPRAHAFKGKLPWPHAALMQQIMGRSAPTQDGEEAEAALTSLLSKRRRSDSDSSSDADTRREQQQQRVLDREQSAVDADREQHAAGVARGQELLRTAEQDAVDVGREQSADQGQQLAVELGVVDVNREQRPVSLGHGQQRRAVEQSAVGVDREQQLLRAVEQSAMAAAGMARSVQDLVAMMQDKAAQVRELQQQAARDGALAAFAADERGMMASIARSLEHSSRASADLARGYCKIIERFEQEAKERD